MTCRIVLLADKSLLPLPRSRPDLRSIEEGLFTGEQSDAASAPTSGTGASEPSDRLRAASASATSASRQRCHHRCPDGTASTSAAQRAGSLPSPDTRSTEQSCQALAATRNSHPQDEDEDHQLEQDSESQGRGPSLKKQFIY